jgi:hypothetical protein
VVSHVSGDSQMANLKENYMECDNSFDLSKPTGSTKRSFESPPNSVPKMKQLKSLDKNNVHSNGGCGSASTKVITKTSYEQSRLLQKHHAKQSVTLMIICQNELGTTTV